MFRLSKGGLVFVAKFGQPLSLCREFLRSPICRIKTARSGKTGQPAIPPAAVRHLALDAARATPSLRSLNSLRQSRHIALCRPAARSPPPRHSLRKLLGCFRRVDGADADASPAPPPGTAKNFGESRACRLTNTGRNDTEQPSVVTTNATPCCTLGTPSTHVSSVITITGLGDHDDRNPQPGGWRAILA